MFPILHTDINDCISHNCQNGGTCKDGVASYTCTCANGYTGELCQTSTYKHMTLLLLTLDLSTARPSSLVDKIYAWLDCNIFLI